MDELIKKITIVQNLLNEISSELKQHDKIDNSMIRICALDGYVQIKKESIFMLIEKIGKLKKVYEESDNKNCLTVDNCTKNDLVCVINFVLDNKKIICNDRGQMRGMSGLTDQIIKQFEIDPLELNIDKSSLINILNKNLGFDSCTNGSWQSTTVDYRSKNLLTLPRSNPIYPHSSHYIENDGKILLKINNIEITVLPYNPHTSSRDYRMTIHDYEKIVKNFNINNLPENTFKSNLNLALQYPSIYFDKLMN